MDSSLERQIENLRHGDHLCLLYDDPREQSAAFVPFLRHGLARGECCAYSAAEGGLADVARALTDQGVDVEAECRRGALHLLTARDTYLRSNRFEPQAMLDFIAGLQEQALRSGFAGLRGAAEMSWSLGGTPGCDRLIEYEAAVNGFLVGSRMIALCQYDSRRFDSVVLRDVLRTHPLVISSGQVYPNLYYEPPDLVLNGGNGMAEAVATRRVDWMLEQLRRGREADVALRRSEERYRLLVENISEAVFQIRLGPDLLSSSVEFISGRIHELSGYTAEEFLEDPTLCARMIHPDDLADVTELTQRILAGGKAGTREYRVRHKQTGAIIWVEDRIVPRFDGRGSLIGFQGVARDVTDRKRAEEASLTSTARYRSLIENLAQGVFLKDAALRFVVANKPFCRALDRKPPDVIGKTDFDLFARSTADKFHADDLRVLDGARLEVEYREDVGGQMRTLRLVKTPVQDERGQTIGVLGICWDVTEQQMLETQLRQAQKMEAVGMLAGGVAHDFNNLLAVILGNIALALGGHPENHPNRELLLAAERAGVQAAELTNRLLGFARQTILRPVPVRLEGCMEETVRLLRRTIDPRISLEVRPAPFLWTVEADPSQMGQVLLNLCLNARDAMPEGGRLVLEAANVVLDDEYARQHVEARAGEYVRLRVTDTGHGISPEIRPRIFDPFFTTKGAGKGTGLGLAMVFGIVKQHQGWVDCYSEVGRGTRFEIFLPRHSGWAAAAASVQPPPVVPRGGTETILLADDEPMIRTLGKTILERYGYRTLLADDGLEAVARYQCEKIDLVLLDLTMPRLSGHDALQQLVRIDPQVRVLFMSGYSKEHVLQPADPRILGFLNKPFRPEELAQAVREALDRVWVEDVRTIPMAR